MGFEADTLLALGREANYAAFSGGDVTQEHAERYWHDIAEERKFMLGSLPNVPQVAGETIACGHVPLPENPLAENRCERAGLMNVKHIEVGLNSNIGLRRKDNQDSACASHGVYVVCDGMGGGKGGKQASSDVAERSRLAELPTRDLDAIDETLILAQQEVLRLGEQLGGVAGTTISGVLLPTRVGDDAICSDERCYIVNVGDSRTYHMPPTAMARGWRIR